VTFRGGPRTREKNAVVGSNSVLHDLSKKTRDDDAVLRTVSTKAVGSNSVLRDPFKKTRNDGTVPRTVFREAAL